MCVNNWPLIWTTHQCEIRQASKFSVWGHWYQWAVGINLIYLENWNWEFFSDMISISIRNNDEAKQWQRIFFFLQIAEGWLLQKIKKSEKESKTTHTLFFRNDRMKALCTQYHHHHHLHGDRFKFHHNFSFIRFFARFHKNKHKISF